MTYGEMSLTGFAGADIKGVSNGQAMAEILSLIHI